MSTRAHSRFDPTTGFVTVIEENHRLIHDGFMFSSHIADTALANGANLDLLLAVPAGVVVHLQGVEVAVDTSGATVFLYEGTTVSAAGSAVLTPNYNRISASTPDLVVTSGPTVTGVGTELVSHIFPTAGKKSGALQVLGGNVEWVLAPGTNYLLRLNNGSGAPADTDLHIAWYELDYNGG